MEDYSIIFLENLNKIKTKIEEDSLDALLLFSQSNIIYATGIREPTGALIISPKCGDTIITSILDYSRISSGAPRSFEVYASFRGSDERVPSNIPRRKLISKPIISASLEIASKCGGKLAADISLLPFSLGNALKEKNILDFSDEIINIRKIKNKYEIELIEKAAEISEKSFIKLINTLNEKPMSEVKAAALLALFMKEEGAWSEAFPSIVAFYSNTAFPHHTPTLIKLSTAGPILIDWGATYIGYRSDETRMLYYGKTTRTFLKHYEIVLQAHLEAAETLAPGIPAWEPDAKAREILKKEGLATRFIHGLGHGVGVDIHEEPYLRPGSKTVLEPGMIVTVEPGIYLDGIHGIRIEDTYLITKKGARRLTNLDRILLTL